MFKKKEGAVETKWLSCSISPGQFPTEYAVAGTQYNGTPFSLFAPKDAVSAPPGAAEGLGAVRVTVIDRQGSLALVRLPAQTFENGYHITVSESELSADPVPRATPA